MLIFLWQLLRNAVLTRDDINRKSGMVIIYAIYVTKRNWRNTCSFCVLLLEWFGLLLDPFWGLNATPIVFGSSLLVLCLFPIG